MKFQFETESCKERLQYKPQRANMRVFNGDCIINCAAPVYRKSLQRMENVTQMRMRDILENW